MRILKGILKEQLESAGRLKKGYEQSILNLHCGALVSKRINNRVYYYNELRDKNRISFEYLGKLDPDRIKAFNQDKHRKNEYKRMIKELNLQIKFLKKVLSLKEIKNV
jgi:hypothetical protein